MAFRDFAVRHFGIALCVTPLSTTEARASVGDGSADEVRDATTRVTATWRDTPDGGPVLALVGPTGADAAVRLTMGASLGRLRHHWTMDLVVEAGTTELVVVDIPREAFLDDLARTYVTQLRVDVWDGVATDRVPVVWLAWPGGPEHEPAVWDDRELRERAPHGVVDPALDAQLAGQFDEPFWVSPPMPRDDGPETPYDGARESTEAQP